MVRALRQFLFVLVALTLVSGAEARSVAPVTMAASPCCMMMAAHSDHIQPMTQGKSMASHCLKCLACVADLGLPHMPSNPRSAARLGSVIYWAAGYRLRGLDRAPDTLPPRTI